MPVSFRQLLSTRKFWPLFVTQTLNALNDNLFKTSLAILATYKLGQGQSGQILAAVAAGLFILPFFIFSATAGQIADKFEKARLIAIVKALEIPILVFGAIGLVAENTSLLLAVLFCAGVQSAFLAPLKYGILPELLLTGEILAANALIGAATFLAILIGTLAASSFVLAADGTTLIGGFLVVSAVASFIAALLIPRGTAADPTLRLTTNVIADIGGLLGYVRVRRVLWLPVLGISWFWLVGATFITLFPAFARDTLHADEHTVSLFLAIFAIGIGVGCLLCTRLLNGEVSPKYVPVGALGLSVFGLDLWAAIPDSAIQSSSALATLHAFVGTASNWRLLADLFLIAVSSGFYIVPLNAYLQTKSEESHRARVIAANNIMNAAFMVLGAAVVALASALGFSAPDLFLLTALASFVVTFYIVRIIPDEAFKLLVGGILKALYRVEVKGLENLKTLGNKSVIVVNHVSLLDAAIVGAFLPGRPLFAIDTGMATRWWVRPFLRLVDAYPLDPTNPLALKAIVKQVNAGRHCVIFPEGRLTMTGALMKIYDGPGLIADRAQAPIVPIRIEGVERLPAFLTRLRVNLKTELFPKVTMTVLAPRVMALDASIVGRARRKAVGRALHDVMTDLVFSTTPIDLTLFEALLTARRQHGGSKSVLEDAERHPLTYRRLIAASVALGTRIAALGLRDKAPLGVLLPTSNGAAVTFFALHAIGHPPALLNFTAGASGIAAACKAANVEMIISSRRFIDAANLESLITSLPKEIRVVYLEELRATLGLRARVVGLLARFVLPLAWCRPKAEPDDIATILFTSGSEGMPKGVALSHRNLLANRAQIAAIVDFNPSDIVFNALPVFHAFGLTGGLLLPLLSGVRTFLYPSPLHYRIIPEAIYGTNATIVFGTDTFLAGYAKAANPYDFYSVRYIFAGAERVKPETRAIYAERFGLRILEGYGATETAPVLAVNTPMHFRAGTVGRFVPGVEARLDEVPGVAEGGRLWVRGPNVMRGYYKVDRPGELQPLTDGWYDTGDIVRIDEEGFVSILGRAKRFAKIAGEMVSLGAVEDLAAAAWPESAHAVVTIPDAKRGEQLVLITTRANADRNDLLSVARAKGRPELWVPKAIVPVDKLPLLGTGKTDYRAATALAQVGNSPTPMANDEKASD